jgi:hypothetical protein
MKKLILLLAVSTLAISLNSCSAEGNGGGSASGNSIKFKLNGSQKTFKSITVMGAPNADGAIYLDVNGTTDSGESVQFGIIQGQTGTNAIDFLSYGNDTEYITTSDPTLFTSNVTVNSADHKLKGTFSGKLSTYSDGSNVSTVTEGTFDITYPGGTASN